MSSWWHVLQLFTKFFGTENKFELKTWWGVSGRWTKPQSKYITLKVYHEITEKTFRANKQNVSIKHFFNVKTFLRSLQVRTKLKSSLFAPTKRFMTQFFMRVEWKNSWNYFGVVVKNSVKIFLIFADTILTRFSFPSLLFLIKIKRKRIKTFIFLWLHVTQWWCLHQNSERFWRWQQKWSEKLFKYNGKYIQLENCRMKFECI